MGGSVCSQASVMFIATGTHSIMCLKDPLKSKMIKMIYFAAKIYKNIHDFLSNQILFGVRNV